jgi:hypothetical protein
LLSEVQLVPLCNGSASDAAAAAAAAAAANEEMVNGRKVGRAAIYMRELISRQVKANQLSRAGSLTDSAVLRRKVGAVQVECTS